MSVESITLSDIQDALSEAGYETSVGRAGKEYALDIPVGKGRLFLRVYTSVDVRTGVSRKKGADAIRVAFIDPKSGKSLGKATRTHRMPGWDRRLVSKINDLIENRPPTIKCPHCKSLMVPRKGEYGKFYGCLSYPDCKFTITTAKLKKKLKKGSRKKLKMGERVSGNQSSKHNNKHRQEDTGFKDALHKASGIEAGEVSYHEADPDTWVAGDSFDFYSIKYPTYNPCQSAVIPFVQEDSNVVLAASTSAGKTEVAAMLIAKSLQEGKKALFASPLKAVTLQKYREWTDSEHPFSRNNVSIVTGDFRLTKKRKKELAHADIILLTSEMVDSKTRLFFSEMNFWLQEAGVLVYDEAHLITKSSRGDAVECGLMRFTMLNPEARILFLSATMPNITELGEWLSTLNGKPSRVIQCDWRPCELENHFVKYPAETGWGSYHKNEDSKREVAMNIVLNNNKDPFIIFVHSKNAGRQLMNALTKSNIKARFHNADLNADKKEKIEQQLENGKIQVIVSTPTLAWGVNLSARRVIILGVHRGLSVIDDLGIEINQMAGRAGRVGLQPKGDSYILIPGDNKADQYVNEIVNVKPITSKILDIDLLAFHITAEIAQGGIKDRKDIMLWYQRSFSYKQQPEAIYKLDEVTDKLLKRNIIKEEKGQLKATIIGKVASWLYYNPFDVADWSSNFSRLFQCGREKDDWCLAWALANIHSEYKRTYIPKQLNHIVTDITTSIKNKLDDGSGFIFDGNYMAAACMYYILLSDTKVPDGTGGELRAYQWDSERVCSALEIVDKYVVKQADKLYWKALGMRLKNRASWTEVELMKGKGIGIVRARRLIGHNVRSIADFLSDPHTSISCVGEKAYHKAAKSFRESGYE